jgi:DNA-binding NarL/FixJ family response regulator
MKVLLVEDNSAVRSVIRQLVTSPGTWIQECVDSTDALAAYAASRPDFVIMDIGTENLDGIAVSKRIKEIDQAARIVLVADYDDAAMRESARHAGACGYALKDNLIEVKGLLRITKGDEA